MPENDEAEVIRVADQIKRYFEVHPNAADTLEGITNWWLLRQRFEESDLLVQKALDYLILESLIERKTPLGSDQVYFRAKSMCNDKK